MVEMVNRIPRWVAATNYRGRVPGDVFKSWYPGFLLSGPMTLGPEDHAQVKGMKPILFKKMKELKTKLE
jgi:hypothetical protein